MTRRIVVISPHADDETLGCGGMAARATADGATITLVVMTLGGIRQRHHPAETPPDQRLVELNEAAATLGIRDVRVLFPGRDMHLEQVPMAEIVTAMDDLLLDGRYDECYFPEPSHHLDHSRTYDAVIAALRPSGKPSLKLAATYEGTTFSALPHEPEGGRMYVDITQTLETKLAALRCHRSQVRAFPHPTSEEGARRLAAMRGLECGLDYAERFRIVRMVR